MHNKKISYLLQVEIEVMQEMKDNFNNFAELLKWMFLKRKFTTGNKMLLQTLGMFLSNFFSRHKALSSVWNSYLKR
jgi:hypothetical protein